MNAKIEMILRGWLRATGVFPERMPDNFEDILAFVIENVRTCADPDNWNDIDVRIAFRRWVEESVHRP